MAKKPGKYDVKPLSEGKAPDYAVVTASPDGTAQALHPVIEGRVREIINSFSVDKYPKNGIIFLPPSQYDRLRQQIESGQILGKRVQQTAGSTEHWGQQGGSVRSSRLGDGFTIPQAGATYINAALLNDDAKLQEVLAHELGHYAADPDGTEPAADSYKDAYLKRGKPTQDMWGQAAKLPAATKFQGFDPLFGDTQK